MSAASTAPDIDIHDRPLTGGHVHRRQQTSAGAHPTERTDDGQFGWWTKGEVLAAPAELYALALEDAPTPNLGGQIHDYLIAPTCAHHSCPLVTADRRQADLARRDFEDLRQQLTLIDMPGVPESR